MRPVARGMVRYESLLDGTIDLGDLGLMNEYLDIEAENSARVHAANAPTKRA